MELLAYNALMLFQQIVIGIIVTALGVVTLKYNYQLVNFTGNVDFAQRYLGGGGTYGFYKLLSITLVIGGLTYATGLGDPVLRWLLAPIVGFFPNFKS